MITKKEMISLCLVILVISLSITLFSENSNLWKSLLHTLIAVSILIFSNISIKMLTAYHLDSEIETKIWEMGKYKFKKNEKIKRLFPVGIIFPFLSKILFLPFGNIVWMSSLVFDVKPKIYRSAKRYGLYTFSNVTEYHEGLIAASGIAINLLLAVFGYLAGFPLFARLNIYYTFFNIIPLSNLDGNKILFGSKVLWSLLASIVLIGIGFALFTI